MGATDAEVEKYKISPEYSSNIRDTTKEPITFVGDVLDTNSLGKGEHDWTVHC